MHSSPAAHSADEDLDIVALWLRKDPVRWMAGVFAGIFAGIVAMVFAMLLVKLFGGGGDVWLPAKIGAIPFLGGSAMEMGFVAKNVFVGAAATLALCAFLGFCYAHFTASGANAKVLLGAGLTWGAFSWIFIFCLYIQSFTEISVLELPKGPAFFVMMAYGLSLASVSFFEKILRR